MRKKSTARAYHKDCHCTKANEKDLIVRWLADRIKDVIQDEPLANGALDIISKEIKKDEC
ncbi:hypothetical protein [Reichenbachiella versicolor]|uniref:hypothetical protein n=1 Tax=Reichenbachiella versicolor TaxID=1821036 RepID=UPI000D6E690E|nr:hypothetical protein [Reichenbachiella versicolor]